MTRRSLDQIVTALHDLANNLYGIDTPAFNTKTLKQSLDALLQEDIEELWLEKFNLVGLFKWLVPFALTDILTFRKAHVGVLRQMKRLLEIDSIEPGSYGANVFNEGAVFLEKAAKLLRDHAVHIRDQEADAEKREAKKLP